MKYDYLIVGAGLYGLTFARIMTDKGYKCLVIDKRNAIGGNCRTEIQHDIDVHLYGPHIFHTNNNDVWNFVNNYTSIIPYFYKPKVKYKGDIFTFPINLLTLNQIWKTQTPEDAKLILKQNKIDNTNFETYLQSKIGKKLYDIFFYGYTKKQWNCEPRELPYEIATRIPIRTNFNDNYFNDKYQGILDYTKMFDNLIKDIDIELNVDYITNKDKYYNVANKILYTGIIDEVCDYKFGKLPFRSLKFKTELQNIDDIQGTSVINYTDIDIPYTRTIEHKHFNNKETPNSILTYEYPVDYKNNNPYYPINTIVNNELYKKYELYLLADPKYIIGGRLGLYKYINMDETIRLSMIETNKQNNEKNN